jgi:uncharacterized RDD family membrane protein YckC
VRPAAKLAAPRRVAAEVLNVAPWVQELPLAAPKRRFWAMAIDLLLVAMVGAMVWSDGGTFDSDGRDGDEADTPRVIAPPSVDAAQALALTARMVAAAASAASAAQAGAPATAATVAASDPEPSAAGKADAAEALVLAQLPHDELVHQVRSLRRQVAELRHPHAWYERGWHWLHGVVAGYGGSLVYFTLVTAFWNGRTLGKRLLGLRVVEITGKPMTLRLAFARYGGYVAGVVTGGIGLAQVLWDPNRQGLQDKVAHTVVVDERAIRAVR